MSKHTVASLAARMDANEALAKDNAAALARIEALLTNSMPAAPAAPAPVVPAPTGKPVKAYRSLKTREKAAAAVAQAWVDAKAAAGVKRVKDLTPAQRAAVDAQVKAIWAAAPKTRATKA